jgi:hypothetical protein
LEGFKLLLSESQEVSNGPHGTSLTEQQQQQHVCTSHQQPLEQMLPAGHGAMPLPLLNVHNPASSTALVS